MAVIGDEIMFAWKINCRRNYESDAWQIQEQTCRFPTSGKYADKFHLSFNRVENSRDYSFFLSWFALDIKEKMEISLFMLKRDNLSTSKRYSFVCFNDTQLDYRLGHTKFCNMVDFPISTATADQFTVGCKIVFSGEPGFLPSAKHVSHYRRMQDNFKQLMENDEFSDFTVEVDNEEFKVYKGILAARSPIFETMLNIEMKEKKTNRLIIEDIDPKIFKLMIEFIYTNKVDGELDNNEVIQLLAVAEKYQLEDLKDLCTDFFKKTLSIQNIADHFVLAVRYKNKSLMTEIKKMITYEENVANILCDVMFDRF